jgi:hypothetical protein
MFLINSGRIYSPENPKAEIADWGSFFSQLIDNQSIKPAIFLKPRRFGT